MGYRSPPHQTTRFFKHPPFWGASHAPGSVQLLHLPSIATVLRCPFCHSDELSPTRALGIVNKTKPIDYEDSKGGEAHFSSHPYYSWHTHYEGWLKQSGNLLVIYMREPLQPLLPHKISICSILRSGEPLRSWELYLLSWETGSTCTALQLMSKCLLTSVSCLPLS